jgi:hypothetical protein
MPEDQRREERKSTDCMVELTWKSETDQKCFEQCRAIDVSASGVAVECPEPIPISSNVLIIAPDFQIASLAQVRHCKWNRSIYVLGLRFLAKTTTAQGDPRALDHYEILRLSQMADQETIERVYRTLARRFHPDNQETGDAESFLRVCEAYRILSDPAKRHTYDTERVSARATPRFELRSRDFFWGVVGEQNRRLAVSCLLYRKRTSTWETPGLSLLELESLTGCTREELGFTMWYLCEQGTARIGDNTDYCITAKGVDFVESTLREGHLDLRAIAAVTEDKPHEISAATLHPAGQPSV